MPLNIHDLCECLHIDIDKRTENLLHCTEAVHDGMLVRGRLTAEL